jgi:hypothetical protein
MSLGHLITIAGVENCFGCLDALDSMWPWKVLVFGVHDIVPDQVVCTCVDAGNEQATHAKGFWQCHVTGTVTIHVVDD